MGNRELEESTRLEDPECLGDGALHVGHVHQAHHRGDEVEVPIRKRKLEGARDAVVNAERLALFFLAGVLDEDLGDVDGGKAGAALGDKAGVVALAAADVKPVQTADVGEHREERRGVEDVAVDVVARPGEPRPRLGVLVPQTSDIAVVHPSPYASLGPGSHPFSWLQRSAFAMTLQMNGALASV